MRGSSDQHLYLNTVLTCSSLEASEYIRFSDLKSWVSPGKTQLVFLCRVSISLPQVDSERAAPRQDSSQLPSRWLLSPLPSIHGYLHLVRLGDSGVLFDSTSEWRMLQGKSSVIPIL